MNLNPPSAPTARTNAPSTDVEEGSALFDQEQVARGRSYHAPLYLAALASVALELGALTLIVFTSLGGRLSAPFAQAPWWAQVVGLAAFVELLLTTVTLPLGIWAGFLHERRFGLSSQSLSGFGADRLKTFGLSLLLSSGALVALVWAARTLHRFWALAAGGAAAGSVLALALLSPLLIEPLFNRFDPLEDPELALALVALACRAQLPIKDVLVADASRRTHKANAYVSGLGPTRRLVVYDTLLARASRRELELVLAHELGHRRFAHLLKGVLLGMGLIAGYLGVLWALLRWGELRSAIAAPRGAASPRVVPLVLLLAASLRVLVAPFGAALTRRWERAADRFSLQLTGDLQAFESTHRSLALVNLADLDPPRLAYLALFSHPTATERIRTARQLASELRDGV